jgi:hypothetical protein
MIDSLKSIGIEKGKPFNPDANTQKHGLCQKPVTSVIQVL